MDLAIAIDSSGSVTEAGFDILKEFTAKLVRRMMAPVQVGIVMFGNGHLNMDTHVVSDAITVTDDLESDMESVVGKIEGLIIQKGFTNMAQAFMKMKNVLESVNARKKAATVGMLVTDGRPSFKFVTGHAVANFRKSNRLMIVHVQANRKAEMAELLKGYASEPWALNYRHIPGKKKLKSAFDSYVTSEIADLCPKLISPSAVRECSMTDGSEKSDVYPCECGNALCRQDDICVASDQYCIPPEI